MLHCPISMNANYRGVAAGLAALAGLSLFGAPDAYAKAPTLFSSPANESPVRGDPDDLLYVPGEGLSTDDRVVYQSIDDTTRPLAHPEAIPTHTTATSGTAEVVSRQSLPDALTIQFPKIMQVDRSYALWVVNGKGEWSAGIRINDARPLWISPDDAYVTANVAALPRVLKVVGRNLQPAPGTRTRVKLVGPATYTLDAADDKNPATAIERYVAKVSLPTPIRAGRYSIQVSRDGVSWVALSGQTLTINPDPPEPAVFSVSDPAYGGCAADDDKDDTACVVRAIAAAKAYGGGVVRFDPGHWAIGNFSAPGVTSEGILLPVGVGLGGAGAGVTFVARGAAWKTTAPTFTAQGKNFIRGFTFTDATVYQSSSAAAYPAPILQLGTHWQNHNKYDPKDPDHVSNTTITQNTFDKPASAIGAGGMPMDHIFITYNLFGGFGGGVHFVADPGNLNQRLRIDDSIITFNTFEPGSYLDPEHHNGVIATGLAGGHRLDFSNNVSDGASTRFLNSPEDAKGWRAAHFWNTGGGSHEEVLISQNTASCTGDKTTDGEFITTDGSGLEAGLPKPRMASGSTATSVTIPGPLIDAFPYDRPPNPVPANYLVGYWAQIIDGPGRGQIRKIVSYSRKSAGAPGGAITFTVSPAWDVIPQLTSWVTVATEYWQIYIVDNTVDQRQPLCTKGNLEKPSGGVIQFWGGAYADSVIEGNTQYDTDGIRVGLGYTEPDSKHNYRAGVSTAMALEIRGNTINGEYDYSSTCSWSGIEIWNGAGDTQGSHPPVLTQGVSISHNTITQADGFRGGAIDLAQGWLGGPPPGPWNLTNGILVFGNEINNVSGPAPTVAPPRLRYATSRYKACPNEGGPRRGIAINSKTVQNTVLSGNTCHDVANKLFDGGIGTQRSCTAAVANSCECP
jgi:hypothetical protein